jgi:capsular polysaccharide biosynthesis protein
MTTRKKSVMALVLGLLCAALVGPVVHIAIGDRYTAFSHLLVSMQENVVLFRDQAGAVDRERFEVYKATQQAKLTSGVVLKAALSKPEVAKLPVLRERDPAEWLAKRLSISFPGRAEVMTVSLTTSNNPQEAQRLVKAVVDAYISEAVNAEGAKKLQKLSELEKLSSEKEQELRKKREALWSMTEATGGSGTDVMSTEQRLSLEELTFCRTEKARNAFEIGRLRAELAGQKTVVKDLDAVPADPVELEMLVNSDPRAQKLSVRLDEIAAKGGATSATEQATVLQKQYDARVKELSQKVREKERAVATRKMIELEARLKNMEEVQEAATKDIHKKRRQAETFGRTSVGMEMLRAEIEHLDAVQRQITAEIEKLKVEINSAPRISVWEPAEVPLAPSNVISRMVLAAIAMLVAFCCVVGIVLFWRARIDRVKTAAGL